MRDYVIETHNLSHYFGSKQVLNGVNLQVPRGSVFGFLGRNGMGKSTTIRILMGLIQPTRGGATVLGHDCTQLTPEVRGRIGYLAEGHHVYGWMNVKEAEKFQAAFYHQWNHEVFEGVVRHFNLEPKMIAGNLSRGQRAGLCLALTLAPEPELLVLDDPALGLDPVARRSLLQAMLFVTRRDDRTILFSSHMLSDVERVADSIAVLDGGVLRASCTLDTFRQRLQQVVLHFDGPAPTAPVIPGLLESMRTDRELSLTFVNFDDSAEEALHAIRPARIEWVPMNLEDAFISYVGERGEKSFIMGEEETR